MHSQLHVRKWIFISLSLALMAVLVVLALQTENFLPSISLNLVSDILGAVLIALFLRTQLSHDLAAIGRRLDSLADRKRVSDLIDSAYTQEDPERAVELLTWYKRRELERKNHELEDARSRGDDVEIEALETQMKTLMAWIKAAEEIRPQ
jgi:hypothetical protein